MQTDWRTQRRMCWMSTRYDFGNLRILPRRSGKGNPPRLRRQLRREILPRHVQLSTLKGEPKEGCAAVLD